MRTNTTDTIENQIDGEYACLRGTEKGRGDAEIKKKQSFVINLCIFVRSLRIRLTGKSCIRDNIGTSV